LERERQQREHQEQEYREQLERERIEREREEIVRREQELKAREPYMCPGQAQMEKAALKRAKKVRFADKPLNLNDRNANNYGELYQSVQNYPAEQMPLNKVKSHELRGGVLYSTCDCTRRNGLQDDCGKFLCQGRRECLTNPPMCVPSGGPGYISPCYPVCNPPCWTEHGIDRCC
jgi:hypothetical protein